METYVEIEFTDAEFIAYCESVANYYVKLGLVVPTKDELIKSFKNQ